MPIHKGMACAATIPGMTEDLFRTETCPRPCEARVIAVGAKGMVRGRMAHSAQGGSQAGGAGRPQVADGSMPPMDNTPRGRSSGAQSRPTTEFRHAPMAWQDMLAAGLARRIGEAHARAVGAVAGAALDANSSQAPGTNVQPRRGSGSARSDAHCAAAARPLRRATPRFGRNFTPPAVLGPSP